MAYTIMLAVLPFVIIGLNVGAFALMGIDKRRARRNQWRISERTLWLSALPFAAPGAYAGMRAFHHKTRHRAFRFGMPALALVQLALMAWLSYIALR